MKKLKSFTLLLCATLFMLAACEKPEKDNENPPVVIEPGYGIVRFSLNGACDIPSLPQESIAITKEEAEVSTLDAIIFKEDRLDSLISLKHVNSEYSFKIQEGDYSMILVANASQDFAAQMEKMPSGIAKDEVLEQIKLSSTPAKNNGLLMRSKSVSFKVEEEEECQLGSIELTCPLVRVDLLSGVEGLSMIELTVKEAHTSMNLKGETFKEENNLVIKEFTKNGKPDEPAINTGVVYLFANENTEISLSYYYNTVASVSSQMGTNIHGYMILGFVANREKLLEITEIRAKMDEGYTPAFDTPLPEYKIGISLSGDATEKSPLINAAVIPYDYEFEVNNAYMVFFKNNSLYEVIAGERYGKNLYQATLYAADTYQLIVLANISEELAEELKNLPAESTDKNTVLAIIANQAPDVENQFLMITEPEFVGVYNDWTYQKMVTHRLASRIDIINGVPGMTIDKAVFENRAKNTTLSLADTQANMLETKDYTGFEGTGSLTDYPIYAGKIYTYKNNSSTNKPTITIHYTLNGTKGTKVIDFEQHNGIAANTLYSVVLAGDNLDANVRIENWTTGYDPVVGDKQTVMNMSLAINNFAQFNVKSFNGNTVTFCSENNSYDSSNPEASGQFLWEDSWKSGDTYTDAEGNAWRIPTREEMALIFPAENDYVMNFNKQNASKNFNETLPDVLFGYHSGGTGSSKFMNQKVRNTGNAPCVIYALRFKGTDQYAAYRYEMANCNFDADNAYLSVKVKALDKDDNIDIYKIVDKLSPDYWRENYVEYIIPLAGLNIKDSRGVSFNLWMAEAQNIFMTFFQQQFQTTSEGTYANIRMVKAN